MSLDNLVRARQLAPHAARPVEVQRLLAAARRNLADASAQGISDETRFDCAYKSIMQCALIGLAANGYRRSEEHTSELQSLMRISYAVFCLKKTKKQKQRKNEI